MEAAILGSQQAVFAVIAATLSLVAILCRWRFGRHCRAPVQFVCPGGGLRRAGVLFVSVTLTPMLCSRFLKVEKQIRPGIRLERGLSGHGKTATGGCWTGPCATVVRCWPALVERGRQRGGVHAARQNFFAGIRRKLLSGEYQNPDCASIHYTNQKSREVEAILLRHGEVRNLLTIAGGFSGTQVNQATLWCA